MGDDANDNDDGDEIGIEFDVVMEARVMSAGEKKAEEGLIWFKGVPGADRRLGRSFSSGWKSFVKTGLM